MTSKKMIDAEGLLDVVSDTDSISFDDTKTPARKKIRGGNVTPSPTNISKPNNIEAESSDSDEDSKVPVKVIDLVSQLETPDSRPQSMLSSHINKPKVSIPLRGYAYPFKLVVKSVNHDLGDPKDRNELSGTVQYAVESLLELKRLTVETNPHFFRHF